MRRRILAAGLSAAVLAGAVAAAAPDAAATAWWAHVKFLADDSMEGRNTGSPAHRRAAEYVAAQFEQAGLEPAGVNGYIQPVTFKTRRIVEAQSSLALVRDGARRAARARRGREPQRPHRPCAVNRGAARLRRLRPARPRTSFRRPRRPRPRRARSSSFSAAAPRPFPDALRAHYQSAGERWAALKQAGVIGTISLANPKSMDVPWARATLARLQPAMALADPSLDETAGQQLSVDLESRARRHAAGGLRPHVRRAPRAGRRRQAAPAFRAAVPREGNGEGGDLGRRVAERGRCAPRQRSEAERRVRRLVRAPGSRRRRPADWRRSHLQRRHGQRVRRRRDPRGRLRAARRARAAEAIDPVPDGHRRGKRAARVAVLRRASDDPAIEHRRQRQHRYVPAALPAEGADGARARRIGSRRRTFARWPGRGAWPCRPIRSRSATGSSEAISTTSSAPASRRWR